MVSYVLRASVAVAGVVVLVTGLFWYLRDPPDAETAAIRADLERLVAAQEAFRADSGRYAWDLGTRFAPSQGVRVTIRAVQAAGPAGPGWWAVATSGVTPQICWVAVGGQVPPGFRSGEPTCHEPDRR